jgi:hypothetical protein
LSSEFRSIRGIHAQAKESDRKPAFLKNTRRFRAPVQNQRLDPCGMQHLCD